MLRRADTDNEQAQTASRHRRQADRRYAPNIHDQRLDFRREGEYWFVAYGTGS